MNVETFALVIAGILVALFSLLVVALRIPKRLKETYFVSQWKELQSLCKDKKSWPQALKEADKLLDRALKKRKFKGKTMGERMVSAQRSFTDNDTAWFAHNIYKKIVADPSFKLKEADVKDALIGFRQALRDLGALPK
ncbi:MAG TPA: hypothetical protein VK674_00705 [Candidatus Limnocylindria bacterium]|nr:hypothetical protein [Candidatus Limnocylindria bacterium]